MEWNGMGWDGMAWHGMESSHIISKELGNPGVAKRVETREPMAYPGNMGHYRRLKLALCSGLNECCQVEVISGRMLSENPIYTAH